MAKINLAGVGELDTTELRTKSLTELAAVYNAALKQQHGDGAKLIKRFSGSKDEALKRVNQALLPMLRTEARDRRKSPMAKTATIRIIAATNPKKPGSLAAERFAVYKPNMTVGEAYAAGLRAEDLRYDVKHGYIEVVAAAPARA
jgi:hypothetical protein